MVFIVSIDWPSLFQGNDDTPSQTTFSPDEIERLLKDWPISMAEVDKALTEYRNLGGDLSAESAIRRRVQANMYDSLGWTAGRAEYLIRYLFMIRNALIKNSEQHRALGYFMEHYQRNQTVDSEIKMKQIEEIRDLLGQIDEAPDIGVFPPGDVELMLRYFEDFHTMLLNYGSQSGLS